MSRPFILLFALAGLIVVAFAALMLGVRTFSPAVVVSALVGTASNEPASLIIYSTRLPRLAIALAVGAALGLSGAILQLLTRNALADPGILGINSGAALAVVLFVAISGEAPSLAALAFASTVGAGLTGVVVYLLAGGRAGIARDSLRLVLSGAVLALTLGSLVQIFVLLVPNAFELTQLWLAGSVADRPAALTEAILPVLAVVVIGGMALGLPMASLMLTHDQATALGVNQQALRGSGVLVAAALCGLSVALAGPLAFVGLLAPHAARALVGPHPAALFPLATILGGGLVIFSDVIGRLIIPPSEVPIGVTLALIGAPVFLIIATRRRVFS